MKKKEENEEEKEKVEEEEGRWDLPNGTFVCALKQSLEEDYIALGTGWRVLTHTHRHLCIFRH